MAAAEADPRLPAAVSWRPYLGVKLFVGCAVRGLAAKVEYPKGVRQRADAAGREQRQADRQRAAVGRRGRWAVPAKLCGLHACRAALKHSRPPWGHERETPIGAGPASLPQGRASLISHLTKLTARLKCSRLFGIFSASSSMLRAAGSTGSAASARALELMARSGPSRRLGTQCVVPTLSKEPVARFKAAEEQPERPAGKDGTLKYTVQLLALCRAIRNVEGVVPSGLTLR